MRLAFLLLVLLSIGACKKEPDFETRYERAVKEVDARAKAMDADIAEAERAAKAAGADRSAPTEFAEPGEPSPQ